MIHLVSDIRFSTDLEFFPLFKLTSLRGLLTALLAGQFSQLVEVYLSQLSTLSGTTLSTVFSALQNTGDHRLRTLHISGVNLSSLNPDLLQAVVRLDTCCLEDTHLTSQQVSVIFKSLQDTPVQDLQLRVLKMNQINDLSTLNPGMIQSVVKLEALKKTC